MGRSGSYTIVQTREPEDPYSPKTQKARNCLKCLFCYCFISMFTSLLAVTLLIWVVSPELYRQAYERAKFSRRSLPLQAGNETRDYDADRHSNSTARLWDVPMEDGNSTNLDAHEVDEIETILLDVNEKRIEGKYEVVTESTKQTKMSSTTSEMPETTTEGPTKMCLNDWTYFGGTQACYKVFQKSIDFTHAHWKCRYYNSYLSSIHSEEEQNFISDLLPSDGRHWLSWSDGYWLGVNLKSGRSHGISTGKNIDGTMLDFTAWAFGEPDNFNRREDCVIMYPRIEGDGHFSIVPSSYWNKWNDVECGKKAMGYVCKSLL